jgi:hypothetical protein
MIARHTEAPDPVADVWKQLALPVDPSSIEWRQDGRPIARDGKFFARFVAYIEAGLVRSTLDRVVPGEWNLTLTELPNLADEDGTQIAIKARLQILGVVREDIGQGKDYKQASTDSFKRAAVRFGIGHELYDMEKLWVPMDGDSKFAKPLQDPKALYAERQARADKREDPRQLALGQAAMAKAALERQAQGIDEPDSGEALDLKNSLMVRLEHMRKKNQIGASPYASAWAFVTDKGGRTLAELLKVKARLDKMDGEREYAEDGGVAAVAGRPEAARAYGNREEEEAAPREELGGRPLIADDVPSCPKCDGRMWDNRIGKRNPKAPDFKCRDRGCDGVIWPGEFQDVEREEHRRQNEEIPF